MDSAARNRAESQSRHVTAWVALAADASAHVDEVARRAEAALASLREVAVEVPGADGPGWVVLRLGERDAPQLAALAHDRALTRPQAAVMADLLDRGPRLVEQIRDGLGLRRFFTGRSRREAAARAARELASLHSTLHGSRFLTHLIDVTSDADAGTVPQVRVADALGRSVGLGERLVPEATSADLVDVHEFAGLGTAVATMLIALHTELEFRDAAHAAAADLRVEEASAVLAAMPLESLREATRGRLPVTAFRAAGFDSVLDVFERIDSLEEVPTVGPVTARRLSAAARAIWRTTYESTPVQVDLIGRPASATRLLARLALWGQVRTLTDPATELARVSAVNAVLEGIGPATSHLAVFGLGETGVEGLRVEIADVLDKARRARVPAVPDMPADPWRDFLARPAHYYTLLSDLGFLKEPGATVHGDVPSDVVEAIRAQELHTEYLTASLRGYQDFAARFMLVQERVVIGDEMGLGKTVEALAALAHLRSEGHTHFLVVCPAAVVTNWVREVPVHTRLEAHRLHGSDRAAALEDWRRDGGVAITSFGTLRWAGQQDLVLGQVGCVIVDEAHYIKNPDAKRSRRTASLLAQVPRVVLMTGTPLLNRLGEFRSLVAQVRPDLLTDLGEAPTAHEFREVVAPVYLRRNQEDVLTELPDLVEIDDWVPMSVADQTAYLEAVEAGNFMAMRQAACGRGAASAKLRRLVEIVAEAEANGRRVIVYSHFRAVLDAVVDSLPGPVFGPLNGSVPPAERQRIIDDFAAAPGGVALVAQIVAAGVGLNIQAASVVVICEPQLTPATEWQAIARAHRMGQLQSVQVHRLLSDEGVDERITELLAEKRALFDDVARISDLAHSAPEAFDITEADLARQVVAAERERLLGP